MGILSIFKNLLRGWDRGRPRSPLLGRIPNFHRFFILMAPLIGPGGILVVHTSSVPIK